MEALGYNKTFGDFITVKSYIEEDIEIGGSKTRASAMNEEQIQLLIDELDNLMLNVTPDIKRIFHAAGPEIVDLIRVVNQETRQGFEGMYARGKALDIQLLDPTMFGETTWIDTTVAATTQAWFKSSATPLSIAEEEGYIIVGAIDPVVDPVITRVMIVKNSDPVPWQAINWEILESNVMAFKEPILLLPDTTAYGLKYPKSAGTDQLTPLGLKIVMGKNLLSQTFA